jgi:hypothetical protein
MAKKKIVLLIVEGNTDERLMALILNKLNSRTGLVQFEVVSGDAFTADTQESGKTVIKNIVEKFIARTKIQAQQIACVGYLVDVDGIFVSSEHVTTDKTLEPGCFKYDLSKEMIVFGSERKRELMQRVWQKKRDRISNVLHDTLKIRIKEHEGSNSRKDLPVRLYFNNMTLEHVLANQL